MLNAARANTCHDAAAAPHPTRGSAWMFGCRVAAMVSFGRAVTAVLLLCCLTVAAVARCLGSQPCQPDMPNCTSASLCWWGWSA